MHPQEGTEVWKAFTSGCRSGELRDSESFSSPFWTGANENRPESWLWHVCKLWAWRSLSPLLVHWVHSDPGFVGRKQIGSRHPKRSHIRGDVRDSPVSDVERNYVVFVPLQLRFRFGSGKNTSRETLSPKRIISSPEIAPFTRSYITIHAKST